MKYSKEIVKQICDHICNGSTQKDASYLSNIHIDTFHDWMNNKPEFSESIKKAHAKFKEQLITTVKKASSNSWQAAAWILERRYKEDYALRVENTGKDGEPLQVQKALVNLDKLDDESLKTLAELTAKLDSPNGISQKELS